MKFVRVSTRLFCDIYEAFRGLTKDSRLEIWSEKKDSIISIGDEKYVFDFGSFLTNQSVIWILPDDNVKFIFNLMKCAAKTEYCTEVHLIIEKLDALEIDDTEKVKYEIIGALLLEQLRKHYNKDWVILDTDLHLGQLRGSI